MHSGRELNFTRAELMMSAVKVSLSNRSKIPLPATRLSTKQLCLGNKHKCLFVCCILSVGALLVPRTFNHKSKSKQDRLHCMEAAVVLS